MPEAHLFSKVVISGDVVEVYTYSSAIKVGQERPYDIVRRNGTEVERPPEKREDNLFRARQNVRRLNSTAWEGFWCASVLEGVSFSNVYPTGIGIH